MMMEKKQRRKKKFSSVKERNEGKWNEMDGGEWNGNDMKLLCWIISHRVKQILEGNEQSEKFQIYA